MSIILGPGCTRQGTVTFMEPHAPRPHHTHLCLCPHNHLSLGCWTRSSGSPDLPTAECPGYIPPPRSPRTEWARGTPDLQAPSCFCSRGPSPSLPLLTQPWSRQHRQTSVMSSRLPGPRQCWSTAEPGRGEATAPTPSSCLRVSGDMNPQRARLSQSFS